MRVGGDGASLAAADELAEKASASASASSELDLRLSFDGRRCKEEPLRGKEE